VDADPDLQNEVIGFMLSWQPKLSIPGISMTVWNKSVTFWYLDGPYMPSKSTQWFQDVTMKYRLQDGNN